MKSEVFTVLASVSSRMEYPHGKKGDLEVGKVDQRLSEYIGNHSTGVACVVTIIIEQEWHAPETAKRNWLLVAVIPVQYAQ